MNFINRRIGFFIKKETKTKFEIYYFIIDDFGQMFYNKNYPFLESLIN